MNSGCGEELHQPRKRCLTCLHKTLQYHQSQPGTKHHKRTRVSSTTSSPRRRTVRFASPLEIVHRVPSIWDLVEEHEMETLWIQADSFLHTIGEAVSQTEQEDPQLMAQEQYLQSLTEIYRHCCKGGDDDDDSDDCLFDSSDDDDDDDSHHTSLQLVSPLLATYRGLEFVVVPELYKLRSRQRAASIQNLCALSRQVTGTSSCTTSTTSTTTFSTHSSVPCLIAQVASRSSRTARRFARAMGMADALAVQDEPEKPDSNATTSTISSQDCCHPRIQAVSPTTVSNIDGNSDSRTTTTTTTVSH